MYPNLRYKQTHHEISAKDVTWAHQHSGQKQPFHQKFFFTALIIIISITYIFDRTMRSSVSPRPIRGKGFQQPLVEEDFIPQAIQTILDTYNPTPVHEYCAHDSWNTRQAVSCGHVLGDIGDTRQRILGCLRHAMLSGMGFVIPSISLTSDDSSSIKSTGGAPFNHGFNQELFISRLSAACPQMPIYNNVESATKQEVEVFSFSGPLAQMNICDDSPGFAANFGSLLTFPTSIYHLAFSALHKFSTLQNVSIDPSSLHSQSTYLGVHFKTSSDDIKAGWGSSSYEKQSKHYLSLASTLKLPVIYASGNTISVFRFMAEAAALSLPIKVVTKETLLSKNELEELKSLTWDQAELVDHVLLQGAGFFAGIQESSLSWSVAMARGKCRGGEESVCGQRGETLREGRWWRDNWSMMLGDCASEFRGRTWP